MSRGFDHEKNDHQTDDMLHYDSFESPIGTVYVATDGKMVVGLSFTSENDADFVKALSSRLNRPVVKSSAKTKQATRELREYFDGKREKFSFSPDISRFTRFQKRALAAAMRIPYGQTRTYAWLARQAGSPRASRAAGQAMARNEIPIIIPCHRVIGSSGGLCGFAGGLKALDVKRKLLELEGICV